MTAARPAHSYEIGLASPREVARLPDIERRAGALFDTVPATAGLPVYFTELEDFMIAQREGLLWVARSATDGPVGFALVERLGREPHLEELDVLPEHQRRGLGAELVRTICRWATARGLPLTLTTFRDVPWNQPFYERLGFRVLQPDELSDPLLARIAEETAAGLPPALRVAMRFLGEPST